MPLVSFFDLFPAIKLKLFLLMGSAGKLVIVNTVVDVCIH